MHMAGDIRIGEIAKVEEQNTSRVPNVRNTEMTDPGTWARRKGK